MSDSCSSKSGRCAFCGEQLSNSSAPIPVAYGAPSDEGRGTFSKLKPLRWRFLSNKAPRTKFMCGKCAEKRQKPQVIEQPPFSLDSSWSSGTQISDQALRLDHLREPRDNKAQHQKREKLQEEQRRRHESQRRTHEPSIPEGRRRGSSQGVLQPIGNHRNSRESMSRQRQASAADIKPRTSVPKQHQRASVESATRPRRSSSGRSEPRGSEKKGQRLSSTADILGMSRSLEMPPNYFEMSSKSPKFCAASAPEGDSPMDWKQLEIQLPQVQPRKQNETEEERQRRRGASYAHMLLQMRRHYDAVQVNGANGYHPATAPPRRIRAERRAQSVAVRNVKDGLVMADLTKEEEDPVDSTQRAIDLDYLRAFKDAR
ncbi:hypothetical protein PHYSODRAFT_317810 [Phytophthora sojae]|uniref:Uncharacterized protein n=1 Tax=Phytophthora sojae (strain P6497) TaxID=1094619 RepID=G5A199_PHYSP|nr:hypothetical protein PHYSODRAFT_317810 [Phytophthora sojae]EGZ10699.1 hypothetical protein PHYSODRAFT_317810 [Phytophthora sojae]|eukprot:XP_009533444.1 hypothetical protein PHYSODRAFT_317810 [Phytophthora sojae]